MTDETDGAREEPRGVFKVLKLPEWWKKKDKAAERRAVGARIPAWLVAAPLVLGVMAAVGEALFMTLFVIRAVGDFEWSLEWVAGNIAGIIPAFEWSLHVQLHPLLFAFLMFASVVIVAWSILWIPMFLALAGHGRAVRGILIGTGLFCNAIVLLGGFHGQNTNRLEDLRTEVVAQRELDSAVTAAQSALNTVNADLRELLGPDDLARPSIQMQACRAGAEAWPAVVRAARAEGNPNAGVIERAQEVAGRCDALRGDRAAAQLTLDQAQAAANAAVTVRQVGAEQAGDGAQAASEWVDEWRPAMIAAGLSLIAIFSVWIHIKMAEARALYVEPEKPAQAAPEPAPAPGADPGGSQGPGGGDPLDGLVLPPLPDLRGVEDPDFDRLGPMDEHGRRLRRVAGHFRPEPAAKPSPNDARRAADPVEPKPSQQADGQAAPGDGSVNFDDILDGLNQPKEAEPAK